MKRSFFALVFLISFSTVVHAVPSYQEVRQSYVKSDSLLLDRHGEILSELRVDKTSRRLEWTPLKNISPALQEAAIQVEDRRFFDHEGVDYQSMGGALIKGLTTGSVRGASTITMQLASLLNAELRSTKRKKSLMQKGRQILEAWEIERTWSKDEILEAYLNLVTFRGELQGIAAASRGLFAKDPHGLERSESLLLASLIRSPHASFAEAVRRVSQFNRSMNWQLKDTEIEDKVKQLFLGANTQGPRVGLAPHLSRRLLKGTSPGSTLRCTLDGHVQRFVLDRLIHHLLPMRSQNVKDGAVLVLVNRTGDVLSYVSHSGDPLFNGSMDGVQAKRQAGSTLKPFLYGLAFDQRLLTPASLLDDSPLDVSVLNGIYQPGNYDSRFKGWVTARVALASSLNVPAVKVLSIVGIERLLGRLRELGIKGLDESGDFYGPSLALGSADVSLWELADAYRALANDGWWTEPNLVPEGKRPSRGKRVFSKEAAFLVSDILSDREARSVTFGLENPLATRFWTAVKTGTSKDMRDNWCIGYSKKYTVGVWVGNFSGEPMWNVSGITGAAPIWADIMSFLHQNEQHPKIEPPASIVRRRIEFPRGIDSVREEWFIYGTEPDSQAKKVGQFNQRILYPPAGAVIALDPDIPPEFQKVLFVAQGNEAALRWKLGDESTDAAGRVIPWTPGAGKHLLTLADREGKILDCIYFEVKGPGEKGSPLFEGKEEAFPN